MLADGFACSVSIGQVFFIDMAINSPNSNVYPDTRTEWWTAGFQVSTSDENYPSRDWKFYEHDSGPSNCAGVPIDDVKRGWVARGGFGADSTYVGMYNWWYTMTVSSNTPPEVSDNDIPHNTLSLGPQHVEVAIDDCDPANPPLAGVASASIIWALDGIVQGPVSMTSVVGDLWEGYIPGEPAGHTISFFVKAFDMEGAIGFGASAINFPVARLRRIAIIAEESYETTEPTINSHIVTLKASGADVFFNITTPKFAAQAIKKRRDRMETAALPQQRLGLDRQRDQAGRLRRQPGRPRNRTNVRDRRDRRGAGSRAPC